MSKVVIAGVAGVVILGGAVGLAVGLGGGEKGEAQPVLDDLRPAAPRQSPPSRVEVDMGPMTFFDNASPSADGRADGDRQGQGRMSRDEMRAAMERFRSLTERGRSGEVLSMEELRELHEMRERMRGWQGARGRGGLSRGEARFDLDGDGVLNDEERAAMEASRMERLQNLRADLEGRLGGTIPVSDENLQDFANAIQREQGRAWREIGMQEMSEFLGLEPGVTPTREQMMQAREEMRRAADLDGDGETTEREMQQMWRSMMQDFQERRGPDVQNQVDQSLIARYDRNGDGILDDTERSILAREIVAELETERLLRAVDVTGDGNIDANESAFFIERFQAGDPSADINGDGVVDHRDLQMFNNLMQTR
jgi:hypothetical protein